MYLDTLVSFSPVPPPLDPEPSLTPPGFSSGSSRCRGPRFLPVNHQRTLVQIPKGLTMLSTLYVESPRLRSVELSDG